MEHLNGNPLMRAEDRIRLLPPRRIYEELVDKVVETWRRLGDVFQVAEMTPDRLAELVAEARKAQRAELEGALQYKMLQDARRQANHAAYRALLRVRRTAKAGAKDVPLLAEAFAFLTDALKAKRRAAPTADKPPA